MTVYVDDMWTTPLGRFGRLKMSHMIAGTDDELHAMAATIGVARRWHQGAPQHDSHYDIAISKRRLAVAAGAVEITLRQCACMSTWRRMRGGALLTPAEAEMSFQTMSSPEERS
jgi:Protein of unknown function (DUF4031)